VLLPTAIASFEVVNDTPNPSPPGNVAGLVNFVPNPLVLQGYAETNGVVRWATAR